MMEIVVECLQPTQVEFLLPDVDLHHQAINIIAAGLHVLTVPPMEQHQVATAVIIAPLQHHVM